MLHNNENIFDKIKEEGMKFKIPQNLENWKKLNIQNLQNIQNNVKEIELNIDYEKNENLQIHSININEDLSKNIFDQSKSVVPLYTKKDINLNLVNNHTKGLDLEMKSISKLKNENSNNILVTPQNKISKQENNLIPTSVSYYDYLKYILCPKQQNKNPDISNILSNYKLCRSFFENNIDILTYYKTIADVKNLKMILFEKGRMGNFFIQ